MDSRAECPSNAPTRTPAAQPSPTRDPFAPPDPGNSVTFPRHPFPVVSHPFSPTFHRFPFVRNFSPQIRPGPAIWPTPLKYTYIRTILPYGSGGFQTRPPVPPNSYPCQRALDPPRTSVLRFPPQRTDLPPAHTTHLRVHLGHSHPLPCAQAPPARPCRRTIQLRNVPKSPRLTHISPSTGPAIQLRNQQNDAESNRIFARTELVAPQSLKQAPAVGLVDGPRSGC